MKPSLVVASLALLILGIATTPPASADLAHTQLVFHLEGPTSTGFHVVEISLVDEPSISWWEGDSSIDGIYEPAAGELVLGMGWLFLGQYGHEVLEAKGSGWSSLPDGTYTVAFATGEPTGPVGALEGTLQVTHY